MVWGVEGGGGEGEERSGCSMDAKPVPLISNNTRPEKKRASGRGAGAR
jgi:hypothetical protein